MHLHRTYNRSFINVTERVWRQVVQLADWVEYHKYSQATVGSMGGGVLANEIAANFKKSKDSKGSRRVRRDDSLGSSSSSLCTQLWQWKFQVVAQDRGKVIETELSCGEARKENTGLVFEFYFSAQCSSSVCDSCHDLFWDWSLVFHCLVSHHGKYGWWFHTRCYEVPTRGCSPLQQQTESLSWNYFKSVYFALWYFLC